jgi:hypothetical protein
MARAQRCENALRHHGAGGRKIDEAAHPFAFDNAARTGGDSEHDIGRRQACHNGFCGIGDFGWRARSDGAECGEIADRFLARVVDHDPMPGLDEAARHVCSHIAEADEADVHGASPSPKVLLSSCPTYVTRRPGSRRPGQARP